MSKAKSFNSEKFFYQLSIILGLLKEEDLKEYGITVDDLEDLCKTACHRFGNLPHTRFVIASCNGHKSMKVFAHPDYSPEIVVE